MPVVLLIWKMRFDILSSKILRVNDVFLLIFSSILVSSISSGRGKKYRSELLSSHCLLYINGNFTVLSPSASLLFSN